MTSRSSLRVVPPSTAADDDDDDASGGSWDPSFLHHLRSTGWHKLIFYQTLPSAVVLLLTYISYLLLSSAWVSYFGNLSLLFVGLLFCYLMWPDKSIPFIGVPLSILLATFCAYHAGWVEVRAFVLLSGALGILAVQVVNTISVFSGQPVSLQVQAVCFATALVGPLIASAIQLMMAWPSAYLCGLLLSCSASLFNLLFNRTPHATSHGIPGRDYDVNGRNNVPARSGLATPQVGSPSMQFVKKKL